MIRILIAERQEAYAASLRNKLGAQRDFIVVGCHREGRELMRAASCRKPHVVLLGLKIQRNDFLRLAAMGKANSPRTRMIIMSRPDDFRTVFRAFAAGASAYVTRKTDPGDLCPMIRFVARGGSLMSPEIAAGAMPVLAKFYGRAGPPPESLSAAELQVMGHIGAGMSNKAISRKLGICEGTIRNHISSALQKTGLSDRTQLALFSVKNGLEPD
jgi:DNA-binding NarL/FixJ family response regulator